MNYQQKSCEGLLEKAGEVKMSVYRLKIFEYTG